jgi:hypothetical protein
MNCIAPLRRALAELPELMRELRCNLTRQNQAGSGNGGRGRETPLPYDVNSSEVYFCVTNTVAAWIRELDAGDLNDINADTMTAWCRWLLKRIPRIRGHQDAAQLMDEILYAHRIIRPTIDRPPDREYVCPCVICGHGVYATPGAVWVACQRCTEVAERDEDGRVTGYVPEYTVADAHLNRLAVLRDQMLTEQDVLTAVEVLRKQTVPAKTLRSWINRGRLPARACSTEMTRDQSGNVTVVLLYWVDEALTLSVQLPSRPLIELVNDRRRITA